MKKLLLVTGAAIALGTVGVSSAAVSAAPSNNTGITLPGFYVGVGAGYGGMYTKLSSADKRMGTIYGGHSEKTRGFAARGSLGYLWALPQVQNFQLGAELGYNYYPKNKYSIGTAPRYSWNYKGWNADLLAVGKYNFNNTGFNIIGKAGAAYIRQKTTIVDTSPMGVEVSPAAGSYTKKAVKPEAAIGVGYDINQNIGINLIYSHIFGSKPKNPTTVIAGSPLANAKDYTKIASVDTILLNVTYHFGNLDGLV
ncbi:MAG: outer membrane beta-barrel protein [Gammaproteobacteria bacterium]|jgi:outer membrane immunogenic protein